MSTLRAVLLRSAAPEADISPRALRSTNYCHTGDWLKTAICMAPYVGEQVTNNIEAFWLHVRRPGNAEAKAATIALQESSGPALLPG